MNPVVPTPVILGAAGLTPADVIAVARAGARVEVSPDALVALGRGRAVVDKLAGSGTATYGVSTGFGALGSEYIAPELRGRLQHALVRSHAAGMGPPVEAEVVRALMLLRLRTLTTGCTGVRPIVAETLAALLNAGIVPAVREHGSLGCSGDLSPLAHVALVLLGEGEVIGPDGHLTDSGPVLAAHGIRPLDLEPKEGLALINGTDGMLGMLILATADFGRLLKNADIAAAMSIEALRGTGRVFDPQLHALRPHPGQAASAANLALLLAGSGITTPQAGADREQVQDAYSLRCAPQVAGAARDTLAHALTVAERELASAIDNPVVLVAQDRIESNGNFHGAPLAFVLDFLAIAAAETGSIAERRTDRILDPARSQGLPPFLAAEPGLDSGLMIAQYTQAALLADTKRLATPASVDSIPTSAMQEDHVSMGWSAARKLRTALNNLTGILSIEMLTAARALDLRSPLKPAPATAAAVTALRAAGVGGPGADRYLSPELRAAEAAVRSGAVLDAVEESVGALR
ncbi:histidine ammonia-lyase [Catenulispora sp. GP43]|uniref:histidine ammonia-lyase n=1 Tax=Catenulispora sp. GP43 TaxID=3156263 RepID=UPI003517E928